MKITRKSLVRASGAIVIAGALLTMTACMDEGTLASTPSMCAYTVGDGDDGRNRSVHDIRVPGDSDAEKFDDDKENVKYFPCGSRNYAINPTSGDALGQELLNVRTAQGTPIKVSLTAQWMVNQDKDAIRTFIAFCEKYRCASDSPDGSDQDSNNSTSGWQSMLGENFHATLKTLAEKSFAGIDDTVWQEGRVDLRTQVAEEISKNFADEMRARTGGAMDLFCGSTTPTKDGNYDCTAVRITDVVVEAKDQGQQDQANKAKTQQSDIELQNKIADDRIRLTDKLYPGIGAQVRACQDLGKDLADCVFSTGPANVVVPQG